VLRLLPIGNGCFGSWLTGDWYLVWGLAFALLLGLYERAFRIWFRVSGGAGRQNLQVVWNPEMRKATGIFPVASVLVVVFA
jgi:hypothetical protein